MRFHHLAVTAFGPFATTQTVDFDELGEAGIFLLTGPAGAGKTSILDAVCFALYGIVPGVRETRSLRSHHAAEGVRPEVVLEVTIGARRLRVRRSPEWHRPKKRGTGTTREHASATLVELVDGEERLLSSRIAEVGHELGLALGMSSEQFMQVVMLPQGQFQTFLHASSDERQAVLQRLFRTERFSRVEEWMRDHSRELGRRAEELEDQVRRLLAALQHRAGSPLPDPLCGSRLGDCAPVARRWASSEVERATTAATRAARVRSDAERALEVAAVAEREGHQAVAAHERRLAASRRLAELEESAADAEQIRLRLDRHDRAGRVEPLLAPLAAARQAVASARRHHAAAVDRAARGIPPALLPPGSDHEWDRAAAAGLRDRWDDDIDRLRALAPQEEALVVLDESTTRARAALAEMDAELCRRTERLARLPEEERLVASELLRAEADAADHDGARSRLADAEEQLAAAERLVPARSSHERLLERWQAARGAAQDARAHHLDLVDRRLSGIAAELAGQLVDGSPCAVCGSEEHPRPAPPREDAVTLAEQQAAEEEHRRLAQRADQLHDQLTRAAAEVQRLELAARGLAVEAARDRVAEACAAVERADAAAERLPALRQQGDAVAAERQELEERLAALRAAIGERETRLAVEEERRAVAAAAVEEALSGRAATIDELVTSMERARSLLDAAVESADRLTADEERLAAAAEQADALATSLGFGSAREAEEALLPDDEHQHLSALLQEREQVRAAADAVLGEVDDPGAGTVDRHRDQVDALARARAAHDAAAAEAATAADRAAAVARLADALESALATWEPVRAEHATADGLARLVRGTGGDNQLQMRLSSYVLATRLDQVLDAANERLATMRDQRYTLRRTGNARGGSRAGLGLEVLDAWTGEPRAPQTLSGGETFVVSLALALGLADVVVHESGGLRVDTLFIDEGFGMLDPDTLDEVMDRIDALRAGGRVVGVVSHVPELRSRIPAQLHVEKGRHGSTLAVRTLVT
ncbi:AAA family ATPase [Nocardioides caldifontis]|uniref:AAA family ATPase n=1 Tax=Nocardioides caldifontis TaxID=2588938 RepID=UPI0011DF5ADD|nr:SMC family ATPase [Nocardioides caldifontis]